MEKCQFLFTASSNSSRVPSSSGGGTTATTAAATTPAPAAAVVPSRLYRCSTCLLIFPCNDALNLHLTSHHLHPQNLNLNEIKAKDTCTDELNDENVFKCSICDKVYESKVGWCGFWFLVLGFVWFLDIYH